MAPVRGEEEAGGPKAEEVLILPCGTTVTFTVVAADGG